MSGYPQAIRGVAVRERPAARVTFPMTLILPSFGVVVFAVALAQVLFLAQGAQGLFRDSDTGWHIRNGESILETFTLPSADHFSYTREGQPWFAWEWLSDVAYGGAYRIAGLSGVALLAGVAIALSTWAVARLSLSLGANLFFTAGAIILLLGTSSIHWLARPHVFSWLLGLAFIGAAEHARRGDTQWLWCLPGLACVWANVHGSFLLGPAILFVYGVGATVGAVYDRPQSRNFDIVGGHRPPLQPLLVCFLSLLATFINPYGSRLHDHVLTYLQSDYLMDHISEFRSFSFHTPGALYIELFLFIAVIGIITFLRQRAFGPALLGLALLHISLYSARHLPTAAFLMLPLIAAAFTREARSFPKLLPVLDYSDRLRAIDRRIVGIIPVAIVLIVTVLGLSVLARSGVIGFNPEIFPSRAADYLERNHLTARVFAKDQWGGYLIYRFKGRTKVFMDGRSDLYGQQFMQTYAEVADVRPLWNQVLTQYDVGLVLIPPDHALAAALQLSPDWKRIYSDTVATIFKRDVGGPAKAIKEAVPTVARPVGPTLRE